MFIANNSDDRFEAKNQLYNEVIGIGGINYSLIKRLPIMFWKSFIYSQKTYNISEIF